MVPAEGIEPRPVIEITEVADSTKRQTTGTYLEHIFLTAAPAAKINSRPDTGKRPPAGCGDRKVAECGGSDHSQEAIRRGEMPSSELRHGRENIGSYTTAGSCRAIQTQTEYRGLTQGGVRIGDRQFQRLVETVTATAKRNPENVEQFLNLSPRRRLPP
jgi:hypothetical protein